MENFLLISICIAALASSMSANEGEFCNNRGEFRICGSSDVVSSVERIGNGRLELDIESFSTIASHTFRTPEIFGLQLRPFTSKNCVPKFINLTPESFEGLHKLNAFGLQCVKFPMRPNLFHNLESVEVLWLHTVEFPLEYLADFPKIKHLELNNLNITDIDPETFSKLNEGLLYLTIKDRVRRIDRWSFGRFPHLERLTLNGGDLGVGLVSTIFVNLSGLVDLNLDSNGISHLPRGIFDDLKNLRTLSLRHNIIGRMNISSDGMLSELRKIDLAHNVLDSIIYWRLDQLVNLEYLNMSSNDISEISSYTFENAHHLRILDLSNNKIDFIEADAFYGLHLDWLGMINSLEDLQPHSLANFDVELLDLRGHNITYIAGRAFTNLTARNLLMCYHGEVTTQKRNEWGIGDDSIKVFNHKDCGK